MVLKQSRDCEKWLIVAISLICKALCVNVHKKVHNTQCLCVRRRKSKDKLCQSCLVVYMFTYIV